MSLRAPAGPASASERHGDGVWGRSPHRDTVGPGRLVVRHLVVAMVIVIVAAVLVVVAGWSPRIELFVALGVLGAITTVALRRLGSTMVEAMWPAPFPPDPPAPGVDSRVGVLETNLRRSTEDPTIFERRLRPLLADLAAHQLRRTHGLDPSEHPVAAQQLLGDEAWELLVEPTPGPVAPARIERTVTAIEALAVTP